MNRQKDEILKRNESYWRTIIKWNRTGSALTTGMRNRGNKHAKQTYSNEKQASKKDSSYQSQEIEGFTIFEPIRQQIEEDDRNCDALADPLMNLN